LTIQIYYLERYLNTSRIRANDLPDYQVGTRYRAEFIRRFGGLHLLVNFILIKAAIVLAGANVEIFFKQMQ
jgi:hypothetical protein